MDDHASCITPGIISPYNPPVPRICPPSSLARWPWIVAVLLCVAGALFWSGYAKTSTGPAEGVSFNGATTQPFTIGTRLRIGTFNIDGGVGTDDKLDLDRTADVIHGCDIVALNEVHSAARGESDDQAAQLGRKLGMAELFAPVERRWWRDDFGSGMLTDCPVLHWQRFPLSGPKANSNRNLLLVRFGFAGRSLNVLISHLDRHSDHDGELRAVGELFLSLEPPAVLMGDLSAVGSDSGIQRLCTTPGVVDVCATIPNLDPQHHNDWIFLRGLKCVNAGLIDKHASDHAFFWADVER